MSAFRTISRGLFTSSNIQSLSDFNCKPVSFVTKLLTTADNIEWVPARRAVLRMEIVCGIWRELCGWSLLVDLNLAAAVWSTRKEWHCVVVVVMRIRS